MTCLDKLPSHKLSRPLWLVCLAACAHATPVETTAEAPFVAPPPPAGTCEPRLDPMDDSGGAMVSLELHAGSPGAARKIQQFGATLHSRDPLCIDVTLYEPAHLYVFFRSPGGDVELVYPRGFSRKLARGRHRVPPERGALRLDDTTGDEQVYVAVTRSPITSAADAGILAVALGNDAAAPPRAGSAGPTFTPPQPIAVDDAPIPRTRRRPTAVYKTSREISRTNRGSRGLTYEVTYEGDEYAIVGFADDEGIVVLPIEFKHEPAPGAAEGP